MAKRKLNFIELLELLEDADAIMFDGTVTYPAVDTDEEYFGIDIDGDGDQVNYYEDDIDSIIINDAGLIEFTKGTDTYVISILDVKDLD